MSLPKIDYEATATVEELAMLLSHGWEISDDEREARLYSEGWSSIQAAIFSTRSWIADNQNPQNEVSEDLLRNPETALE